ncbi:cell wall metabolism sensor histidine kinase WalK [Arachnia propionica]|nr:ATP-binding protein [Arachnia propionica]
MGPFQWAASGAVMALLLVGVVLLASGYRLRRSVATAEALREAARQDLATVIDALPVAGMLVGPHDEVLRNNPQAEADGVSRGSRVGFIDLLDRVRAVRESGEGFTGQLVRERDPVTPMTEFQVSVLPLTAGHVLVLAEDEAEARRVDAVRRDFVANVSHELKTPIGAITILAETIEAAAADPDDVTHFARRLQQESTRLGELVTQIIELSRLQSFDPMLNSEVVDVPAIIEDALARTRESAEARKVRLVSGPAVATHVVGDRWQLTDALVNLVQNAVNYSDPGARVAVTAVRSRREGAEVVEIKVADNGIGIPPEDQERIFERFYRVDHARSRDTGGTGLGLSIVRHIALAHGGGVAVWSRPHQGSTFTLHLPAHDPEPDPAVARTTP